MTTTAVSTIDANSFSVAINSAISGAGGFNINSSTGTGTVKFGGANTYTGGTTVNNGGTLLLGANNTLSTTATPGATRGVTLAGGTLDLAGNTQGTTTFGFEAVLGTLTLSADSTVALTSGDSFQGIAFSDYDRNAGTLNITGWNGTEGTAGTGGRILFYDSATLDATELANISFNGFGPGATLIDFGGNSNFNELVPVPEPATVFGACILVGVIGYRERKRLPFTRSAQNA